MIQNRKMRQERGTIIENKDHKALLRVADPGHCRGCAQAWLCGVDRGKGLIEAANPDRLPAGSEVLFSFSSRTFFYCNLALYGLPLMHFLAGAGLGALAAPFSPLPGEGAAALLAFAGLGLSFFSTRRILRLLQKKHGFMPLVTTLAEPAALKKNPDSEQGNLG